MTEVPAVQIGPVEDIGVLGGGTAFPRRELDNREVLALARRGRSPEQIAFAAAALVETMGVATRAWAHLPGEPFDPGEETTLDLALAAGRRALDDARLPAAELSLLMVATSTPHRMTTTVAAAVGEALGARCACIDVRGGCAAGLHALGSAALLVAAGNGPALIVGADTFSKVIPLEHAPTLLSLADGAAAIVLGRKPGSALLASFYETDPALSRLVYTDGTLPPTVADIERGGYRLAGAPEELARAIPGKYEEALRAALSRAGDHGVDLYAPHQTGRELLEEVARRMGFPRERVYSSLHRHGNVGAAGWLAALVEARAEGRTPPGARVATAAVGGGVSAGAAVFRW